MIIGDGGHARVIVDVIESGGEFEIAGFTGEGGASRETMFGYECFGLDEGLGTIFASGVQNAFVALGDNQKRCLSLERVRSIGFTLVNAISPHAVVSMRAKLGRGIAIMPGAVVNAGARLGDGVIVNTNAGVDHDGILDDCCHIGPGAALAGRVQVGQGAFLGGGSVVVPGTIIGAWTTVGAGAAVIQALPAGVVAVGVPARILRSNTATASLCQKKDSFQ